MMVSEQTKEALIEIITQCFAVNRKLDRLVSVLGVELACNQMADKIHHKIAHYFPELSDKIGSLCLERYNISIKYGITPAGDENYTTMTEAMQEFEDTIINFHNMFIGVNKIAFDNNDLHVFADLQDMMEDLNKIVEQTILINDKAKQYSNDKAMQMDKSINDFWILDEED